MRKDQKDRKINEHEKLMREETQEEARHKKEKEEKATRNVNIYLKRLIVLLDQGPKWSYTWQYLTMYMLKFLGIRTRFELETSYKACKRSTILLTPFFCNFHF